MIFVGNLIFIIGSILLLKMVFKNPSWASIYGNILGSSLFINFMGSLTFVNVYYAIVVSLAWGLSMYAAFNYFDKLRLELNKKFKIDTILDSLITIKEETMAKDFFSAFHQESGSLQVAGKTITKLDERNSFSIVESKDKIEVKLEFKNNTIDIILFDKINKIEQKEKITFEDLFLDKYSFIKILLQEVGEKLEPMLKNYQTAKEMVTAGNLIHSLNQEALAKKPEKELNEMISALGLDEDKELKDSMSTLVEEAKKRQKIKEKVKL